MIIDSHCHLTYEPMFSSLDETIKRANNDGIKYLLTICTEDKGFENILKIINKYRCVFGSYGIHPHETSKHKKIDSDYIINKIKEKGGFEDLNDFIQKFNNPNQIDEKGFENDLDEISFFEPPKEKWLTYGAVV